MGTVGNHTPDWLSIAAFNDTFDWTKCINTNFSTFFEHVTLHDSYWQTINLSATNETILSIQLDAFWNKEYTLTSDHTDDWPFLVIKIPDVFNVCYNTIDFATTIINSSCKIVASVEMEDAIETLARSSIFPKELYNRLKKSRQTNKTRFDDIYGGNIEILHESEIMILLIDKNGNYINPGFDK